MLLLVMIANLNHRKQRGKKLVISTPNHFFHLPVDIAPIAINILYGRPCDQASLWSRIPVSGRYIVGIEKISVLGMRRPIIGNCTGKNKGFEESGGMGQVPASRTGIFH